MVGATGVSTALLLTGCVVAGQGGGPGMMGRQQQATQNVMGGMGGMGYDYSRLTCTSPATLPGARVQVTLADMGMTRMVGGVAPLGVQMMLHAVPTVVPAGKVSLVARNMGWRTHELVVLRLADDASAGQRVPDADGKVDEASSVGEASSSCAAGEGEGITSGAVGWVTLDLAPGRYELVCNLTNHYANGMHQELDVR
jgi:uncharacterized cupredoxin-like copper-binding protein